MGVPIVLLGLGRCVHCGLSVQRQDVVDGGLQAAGGGEGLLQGRPGVDRACGVEGGLQAELQTGQRGAELVGGVGGELSLAVQEATQALGGGVLSGGDVVDLDDPAGGYTDVEVAVA